MQPTTADQLLDLACLTHTRNDAVGQREHAEAILDASPWLARDDAYVAAAVGDVRHCGNTSTAMRTQLRGAAGHEAGMRCFKSAMAASRLVHPGIRSRARAYCSIEVQIRGRTLSWTRCHTPPSRVRLAAGKRGRLRRRHIRSRARSWSFCSMRALIRMTSRRSTTCISCATRDGSSCCWREDFGDGRGSTICWAPPWKQALPAVWGCF